MHRKESSEHHHKPGEERTISGEVKVHGAVQVFEADSATQQHETERKEDCAYKKATKGYEEGSLITARVALAVSTLYFIVTCLIFLQSKRSADISRDAFIATNRPSVGVNSFTVWHAGQDRSGKAIQQPIPNEYTRELDFTIEIKNFGPITAYNFTKDWKMLVGGTEPTPADADKPAVPPFPMFPGKVFYLKGQVLGDDYFAVMQGKKALETEVTVSYDEATQRYTYCEHDRYERQMNRFVLEGPCKK